MLTDGNVARLLRSGAIESVRPSNQMEALTPFLGNLRVLLSHLERPEALLRLVGVFSVEWSPPL